MLTIGPTIFDRDVLAFDVATFAQTLSKRIEIVGIRRSRRAVEKPDDGDPRLLRPRRERPRRRGAAEQRDELATSHSITSSACASNVGGTSMPSIFAVWRLMTSSSLVARRTGISAGFSPLRTRAV